MRSARAAQRIQAYHPTKRRRQEQVPQQRYGTANEPPPHLGGGKGLSSSTETKAGDQQKALPKIGERLQHDGEDEVKTVQEGGGEQKRDPATVEGRVASQMVDPMLDSGEALPKEEAPGALNTPEEKPMETVLESVPNSAQQNQQSQQEDDTHAEEHPDKNFDEHAPPIKAPHIERPRYIHHFDTYGLVKRLVNDGGWDQKQAITIMKAVRLMLADNTDLAKEALVSKSNLENEAYLFKAACAELKTEVTTRRKTEQEKMRTERTQLQHEVDIISQRLGQESGSLKDDLKGMFDDRKMAVRNEQRDMESKVQQLNYKITVMLQADAKSEVEGLRWLMTRRVILTLAAVVLMAVGGIKLISDAQKDAEQVEKKGRGVGGGKAAGGEFVGEEPPARVLPREVVVKEGDNPAFVSLG